MTDQGSQQMSAQQALDASLRDARLRQSAHHDASVAIRDAQTLRLQVLKDELAPIVAARGDTDRFIDLALIAGAKPRLWIDLSSYVTMAPDGRTFRHVQDTREGSETLAETRNRAEMAANITEFIAHRTIERARELPAASASGVRPGRDYSTGSLILAWLTGLAFGILAVFIIGALFYPLP